MNLAKLNVNKKLFSLFALIVLIGATPPVLFILSPIKSFSVGCLIVACLGLLFSLRRSKTLSSLSRRKLPLIFFVLLYLFTQHIIVGSWQTKSYSSILPLAIMITSAYLVAQEIAHLNSKLVLKAFIWAYYFFAAVGIFNIASNYSIGKTLGYTHAQPIFPFLEPSHYALYFGTLAFIYSALQPSIIKKSMSIALLVAMSMTIPNTTLLTYACLSTLLPIFNLRPKAVFFALPAFTISIIFGVNAVLSNEYFSKRLDVSASENQNTTTLVYLQGVQDAINSLSLTNGMGLGFQMLGTQPPSEYSYSIAKLVTDANGELNRQDGGFLAAKIIAEFGVIGLAAIFSFILLAAKAFIQTRRLSKENIDHTKTKAILFNAIAISFSIEMFIRGYGYFSPGFYLFLIALFYIAHQKLIDKKNSKSRKDILTSISHQNNSPQSKASHSDLRSQRSTIIEAN